MGSVSTMAPAAPWESVPASDTAFVLVTGANSGVGMGICQRLIDTFLATRSLSSHLVLIPTTRSARKSSETTALLRKHLSLTAYASSIQARAAENPAATLRRVHILSLQLDLCDLASVQRAADQLVDGSLALGGCGDVKIPRLDAVIFNAGIGGWTHLNWAGLAHNFLTAGWIRATTWPTYKVADRGVTVSPLPPPPPPPPGATETKSGGEAETRPVMGQVFCANVFGHYLLAHALLPLLSRPDGGAGGGLPPGRIIWESSVEAAWEHFSLDDLEAVRTGQPYESTKRLTDILCLTADLPGVRPHAAPYFSDPAVARHTAAKKPRVYLAHPGIVATTIFPLPLVLFYAYKFATYVSRWIGSPWHTVTSYNGAAAMVWLALAAQEVLDGEGAHAVKWGSAADFWGKSLVKKTEVDGWGWEGRVENLDDDEATGVLRKIKGRRSGAEVVTEEKRAGFEEMGAKCWREMERLRGEWEARIQRARTDGHP